MPTPSTIIRAASPEDLPAVEALFRSSPGATLWTAADLASYPVLVAVAPQDPPLSLAAAAVARLLAPGEAELLNLAVAPPYRRQGLATRLIRHFFLFSPGRWFLEVRETNLAAIHLYEKAGFVRISRRPGYYPDSGEAAIVMGFPAC